MGKPLKSIRAWRPKQYVIVIPDSTEATGWGDRSRKTGDTLAVGGSWKCVFILQYRSQPFIWKFSLILSPHIPWGLWGEFLLQLPPFTFLTAQSIPPPSSGPACCYCQSACSPGVPGGTLTTQECASQALSDGENSLWLTVTVIRLQPAAAAISASMAMGLCGPHLLEGGEHATGRGGAETA